MSSRDNLYKVSKFNKKILTWEFRGNFVYEEDSRLFVKILLGIDSSNSFRIDKDYTLVEMYNNTGLFEHKQKESKNVT